MVTPDDRTLPVTFPASLRALIAPAAATVLGVAGAALAASLAAPWLPAASLALVFVPPVILVAIRHGFAPALATALLGTVVVNYLFVEPRHTLIVARPQDAAALAIFAIVAALSSAVAARARAARRSAETRAEQAALLQALAMRLGAAPDKDAVVTACLAALGRLASGRTLAIDADGCSTAVDDAGADSAAVLAAQWAMSTKRALAPGPEAPSDTPFWFWPVLVESEAILAIGLDGAPGPEAHSAAEQVATLAGLALARIAAAQRAEKARRETERERLKSDLLAGVSHDLRTPLSTILFTLQSLQRFDAEHAPQMREELLALAEGEARRLSAMVEALLDSARIGVDGAPVRVQSLAPRAVVARARESLSAEDAPQALQVDVDPDLPRIAADADLAGRALANIVANAVRHGGGVVDIVASREPAHVRIEVRDRGPGLAAVRDRLFQPFVRGRSDDGRPPGLGLGLSLARTFLAAQGASLSAADAPGGGALFTLRFPIADAGLAHAE